MKINLNFPLLDLDGKDATEGNKTIGQVVATLLIRADSDSESEIFKFYEWANLLNYGKEIDLDTGDQSTFRKFIREHKVASVLLKARVLLILNGAEKFQASKNGEKENKKAPAKV